MRAHRLHYPVRTYDTGGVCGTGFEPVPHAIMLMVCAILYACKGGADKRLPHT